MHACFLHLIHIIWLWNLDVSTVNCGHKSSINLCAYEYLFYGKLNQTPCSFLSPVCTKSYSLQASTWKTNVDEKNKAGWSQGHSKINESCLRVWISLCVLLHPVKPKYGRRRAEHKITSLLIYFIKINIILLIGIKKSKFYEISK